MSSESVNSLPAGWGVATFDDVMQIIRGISFPKTAKQSEPTNDHVACLRTANVQAQVDWDDLWFVPSQYVKRAEQRVMKGDVLISTANSLELVGKVCQVSDIPCPATIGAFISIMRARAEVDPQFLYYQLAFDETQSRIRGTASTTTNISNVSTKKLAALGFRVAPLNEQRRVVEAIEEQFTRLDAGVAALKRVEANLKRYKAAVLKAACEGRLTEQWRAEHPDVEPAFELLKRILAERRKRWEEAELAKMIAKGKPPKNGQVGERYQEPKSLESRQLPAIPNTWQWTTLEVLTFHTIDYRGKTPPTSPTGIPVISAANVKGGRLVESTKYVSENTYRQWLVRGEPQPGDLIITTEAPVGETALYPSEGTFLLTRRVIACQTSNVSNGFLQAAIRSEAASHHLARSTRGTTVPRILKPALLAMPIPLPPFDEQLAIEAELERRMTYIASLHRLLRQLSARTKSLRQSILKRAFEGKLVPQDPSDEPASVLLDRIRAERESKSARKKPKLAARQRRAQKGQNSNA